MDKKLDQIAVHVSPEIKEQFVIIAELQNKSLSELGCFVISEFLNQKKTEFHLMQKAFGNLQNSKN